MDNAKEENRKIKKDLEQAKNDCDQMIKMMENYENKISSFQKKEENLYKILKENKEKLEEALLDRDRCLIKEA